MMMMYEKKIPNNFVNRNKTPTYLETLEINSYINKNFT